MTPRRYCPRTNYRGGSSAALVLVAAAAISAAALTIAAKAHAVPSPDVDYLYNVTVRRQYNFPNGDAIGYGHGICDKVSAGQSFAQVIGDVKNDVTPNDEYAANYLVSYAVSQYCPEQIWQLRNSAAGYRPPPGTESPTSGLQGDIAGK
ncbi:DUF732 domain-containing protein [Mycobacterium xenopi]|uniref:DUF732 domain-containing protein n=1 Tax=Mycobacterium xenopi TaxID=1789 RepID=UPI0022EA5BDF|nr:DUF732 domain-containing protein [Mycobacterium xenopi]MDA3642203.1 DUF732 domain-containing protein [Mycobacterium xenopi]